MSVFWIVAAMMIIIALVFLLPPLLRRESQAAVARDTLNVRIYQDQLSELENDFKIGTISSGQFEQANRDLQRKLLEDVATDAPSTPEASPRLFEGRSTALAIALIVPLLSIGLYLQLDHTRENGAAPPPMADGSGGFSPEMMVQRLAQRLKENPEDGQGWLMLARSYSVQGRYTEATEAYAKALPLVGEQPDVLTDYAEMMALGRPNQDLSGKPSELFARALALDANHPKAIWLSGMADFQQQNYAKAATAWRRLLALMPADVEGMQTVRQHIAEAEARASEIKQAPAK